MVEPTTDAQNNGYKYLRAYFSASLDSLEPSDIEIRAKKSKQLYSVDTVSLSSDGTYADITLFGSVLEGGTHFLDAAVVYAMTITNNGISDTYEFELPDNQSDELVVRVDVEKNMIYVRRTYDNQIRTQAGQKGGQTTAGAVGYKLGDLYDGNLGELVGRTVNIGLNSDNEIIDFSVNDADVVYAAVTTFNGDNPDAGTSVIDSSKDYFQDVDKNKYYISTQADMSSTVTQTYAINAMGTADVNLADDWTVGTQKGTSYAYAKLVLNPTGTVSCAVLEQAWEGLIIATSVDGTVVTETKNNTKDFKDFTIVKDGAYIDATELEDGDIIYYNDTDGFAEVYAKVVTGSIDAVYSEEVKVDGKNYKWKKDAARYYDEDNDKYVTVDEKWLLAADTDEDITLWLNRSGNAVLIDAVQTESVTTTEDYIITEAPVAYLNGVDEMVNIGVSNGTAETLKVKVSDLKYVNSSTKDTWDVVDQGQAYGHASIAGKTAAAAFDLISKDGQGPITGSTFGVDDLLRVTYDADGAIIGINDLTDTKGTAWTTMKRDKDAALKPGLTQILTTAGKAALTDDTNIWIITGKKPDNTDMAVTKVAYSDYDKTTQAGNVQIGGATYVNTLVKILVSETTATDVIVDASATAAIAQNEIFANAEAAQTVIAVVKGVKTGLNSDQDAQELKELTVLNYEGEQKYSNIKSGITAPAKLDFVKIELDAEGTVQKVDVAADAAGALNAAAVGKFEEDNRLATTSTEYVRAGNDFIRPTANAYIAFYDGNDFIKTSIGAINREDAKYGTISYYVSEIQGDDISSEIIIAKGPSVVPTPVTLGATVTSSASTTGWTLPAAAATGTFSATLSFVDSVGVTVSADELTVGAITDGDALKVNSTAEYAKSDMSFSGGVFTVTLTGDGLDPGSDQAGTVEIAVKFNGDDYVVTVTIAKDGKVTAGAAAV